MTCNRNAARAPLLALLATLSATLLCACGSGNHIDKPAEPRYQATITRTAHGIPHIEAADEAGLGFGIGYAYAEDNFCLLAGEIVTVSGERSRWFGPDGTTSENPELAVNNLDSDVFFRHMNDDATVLRAWNAQPPEVQALLRGYAAGVNRYVATQGVAALPSSCRNGAWVRPVTTLDLIRLTRRIAMSTMSWIGDIGRAPQPGVATVAAKGAAQGSAIRKSRPTASNAIALGAEASADGRGMLLGQPHLPWGDALRFYQMHMTIPGKLDVMGASLPGLPVVGIGFTQDFAWTHTTDTSAHFTAYALRLDPADPTRYLVDGQSRPLLRHTIAVPVKQADGGMGTVTRTLYATEYGPLVASPGLLDWTPGTVYALRDANWDNHRVVAQWYEMNKARTLADVKAANLRVAGNPWNYTIAADRAGNTLFMNVAPIANLPDDALAGCLLAEHAHLAPEGLVVLDGSRAACAWRDEAGAAQPGTVPAQRLPAVERRDYVQNANDSAWLANPAAPLTGYPALVSRDGVPQGARTRLSLTELSARLRHGKLALADLRELALDDKVYLAPLLLPDLLAWCGTAPAADEVRAGCAAWATWSGDAGYGANLGLRYFMDVVVGGLPEHAWAVPFDPADPVGTPRGLNYRDSEVSDAVAQALALSVRSHDEAGIARTALLGDFQVRRGAGLTIPIHGGYGELGIFNAIDTERAAQDGRFEVSGGTSYLQVVGFGDDGPRAQALLAYSQSADPASPHHMDQTQLFARRDWVTLPFTAAQIAADPQMRRKVVAQ